MSSARLPVVKAPVACDTRLETILLFLPLRSGPDPTEKNACTAMKSRTSSASKMRRGKARNFEAHIKSHILDIGRFLGNASTRSRNKRRCKLEDLSQEWEKP